MSVGAYEKSLRSQYIDARRRLYGPKARVPVIQLPPPPAPAPEPTEEADEADELMYLSPARAAIAAVAKKHKLRIAEVTSKSRERRICHARWECCFILVVEHGLSLNAAGRRINIDHSSVIYGLRSHLRMNMDRMPDYAAHLTANSTSSSSIHREVSKLYFEDGWKVPGIARELSLDRLEVEAIINADIKGLRRTHLKQMSEAA